MGGLRTTVSAIHQNGGIGIKVVRAAALDVQAWTTIYAITGGVVLVTGLVGVRTVNQAGALSTMQFRHSIATTVLCVPLLVAGDLANTLYTITGNPNDPLISGAAGIPIQGGMMGSPAVLAQQQWGVLMFTGNLQVNFTVVTGGQTRYVLTYIPVDAGATVAAVP